MNNPNVSVIVPIFNSKDTINDCIQSILGQSHANLELVIVDDGSTDGSSAICDAWVTRDERIRVVHQSNKGRSEARFVGVESARGEWIAFVDSDDMLPPNAVAQLLDKTNDRIDIVLGNGYMLPNESRSLINMDEFRHLTVRAVGTIGVPWGSLFRKNVLSRHVFDIPRDIVNGEDYIFWLRIVFSTEKTVAICYENVYKKGDSHTSNSFVWTADYAYKLNEFREAEIPFEERRNYLADMVDDQLSNLFAVAQWSHRNQWRNSPFYKKVMENLAEIGQKLTFKQRFFLAIPSLKIRKLYAKISEARYEYGYF